MGLLVALTLFVPIMLAIVFAVRLISRGPMTIKQERVGINSSTLVMYKFRSMIQNAEALQAKLGAEKEKNGAFFKIKLDPRITRVGAFLRRTSIDELPQFLNVLKGEISLVEPRLPLMSEIKRFKRWQLGRLSVKPGITCTWQVTWRNEVKFEYWMRMDVRNVRNICILSDLKLLYRAAFAGLSSPGGS